jgi:predicted RNase H-like HicB family nuclease
MMPVRIPLSLWKEGDVYVSFTPALDLSTCGDTRDEAIRNMDEAAKLFFQTAEERNCLPELLESYGWELSEDECWVPPSVPLPDGLGLNVNVPVPIFA